jgi:flavin reductase (DIM6/NTAB) family NADH-FMN oxidoreductase RutF
MMDAKTVNAVTWSIPNALCLIGSRHGEEWNGMTQSWVTQVSMEPVLIAVSIDRKAVTNRLVRDGRAFSVNLWDREDTRVFRKFSKPAERDGQALNGRPVRNGLTGVPIFDEAVAWLECRVAQVVEAGTHDLFLGEVVDAGFREGGEDVPVARIEDTRMKYGGVRRGGH